MEFSAKGTAAAHPAVTLIQKPYLDRWYHLAAVRSGSAWSFYVDGRKVQSPALPDIGNANTTDEVCIGGLGSAQRLYGEIQEFAVLSEAFDGNSLNTYRLRDIPTAESTTLRCYTPPAKSKVLSDRSEAALELWRAGFAEPIGRSPCVPFLLEVDGHLRIHEIRIIGRAGGLGVVATEEVTLKGKMGTVF